MRGGHIVQETPANGHRDDWQAARGELRALFGDTGELLVAVWAGAGRDPLLVDAQPVVEALEDTGHGAASGS